MDPGGLRLGDDLALDAAQYQMDTAREQEGKGVDVYGRLNLLVRRQAKENNFKAILACIRDLMNVDVVVHILLRYRDNGGDWAEALQAALPDGKATPHRLQPRRIAVVTPPRTPP